MPPCLTPGAARLPCSPQAAGAPQGRARHPHLQHRHIVHSSMRHTAARMARQDLGMTGLAATRAVASKQQQQGMQASVFQCCSALRKPGPSYINIIVPAAGGVARLLLLFFGCCLTAAFSKHVLACNQSCMYATSEQECCLVPHPCRLLLCRKSPQVDHLQSDQQPTEVQCMFHMTG